MTLRLLLALLDLLVLGYVAASLWFLYSILTAESFIVAAYGSIAAFIELYGRHGICRLKQCDDLRHRLTLLSVRHYVKALCVHTLHVRYETLRIES